MIEAVLEKVLHELALLRREVAEIRTNQLSERHPFELLSDSAVVEKDYVAWRFGISVRAVKCGEKGTKTIPRVSQKPLKFIKREVDETFKRLNESSKKKALEIRANTKTIKRRKSIINKEKRVAA